MKAGIYRIDNIINGKCYIGSSIDLDRRRKEHFYHLLNNSHVNIHLQRSYNKYGKDNFEFSIIEILEITDNIKQELLDKEQFWLDTLKPKYNILLTAGSNLGYNHTEETKEKIRNTTKGVKKSKEHTEHIRNCQKGKTLTEEHKKKLSESAKKRTKKCHTTKIVINDIIYNSLKEASIELNIPYITIQKRLKNPKFINYNYF